MFWHVIYGVSRQGTIHMVVYFLCQRVQTPACQSGGLGSSLCVMDEVAPAGFSLFVIISLVLSMPTHMHTFIHIHASMQCI
jgi:hypothetical protein